ncbi:MAG: sulfatase-like hydrolase/transferase [Planctomycetes bacterium]|nr:sulfatase-like hydrolase/transferase [Planctomycetota bacterium]
MARPNILLLHTDQQRFDTIRALGASHMETPNLDRLVSGGIAFRKAYSSNPVCMPARHDLLTGASAQHHGYWWNAGRPIQNYGLATLPRMLTQSGYQTLAVGKMHFKPEREHHGFGHMFLMEELPGCRENDAYLEYLKEQGYGHIRCQHGVRPLFYHSPQESRVPEEHHGSAWVAHKTIELIRRKRDRPFFLMASWVGPHPPYYMPRRYLEMYRDAELPSPIEESAKLHAPTSPENLRGKSLKRLREAYFGAISLIDTHLGRILDALEQTGQRENTLIIFTSDHGEMLGDYGCYQKHVPYEGSAHIPLLVSGPGFEKGTCEVPVTTWDTSATILRATGVEPPEDHPMVGVPLQKCQHEEAGRTVVFHHSTGRDRYLAAVSGRFKFIHWLNGGEEELYDLESDPEERINLLAKKCDDNGLPVSRLRDACVQFESEHGNPENVDNGRFVDLSFESPPEHRCSAHPEWSFRQFPQWMDGYSQDDLRAIAEEMSDCLKNEGINLFSDPEWRSRAKEEWTKRGGDPAVYEELFQQIDRKRTGRS